MDERALLTKVRRSFAGSARTDLRVGSCLREGWGERPAGVIVHRIGATGESVTFAGSSRRTLHACDASGHDSRGRHWCGHAFGRVTEGRLQDPRLDLGGCTTKDGGTVAFLWVTPRPDTRYVVVHHGTFAEVYETAARLPVRVSAIERIDTAGSRAVVELSEHSTSGSLLREYELAAAVAG